MLEEERPHAWDRLLKAAGFSDENSWLDLSPYVKIAPRQVGSPGSGAGLNLALEIVKPNSIPSMSKLSYPWSICIERDREYDSARYSATAGVSKVFSF